MRSINNKFKDSSYDLVKYNIVVKVFNNTERQKSIIKDYYEGFTNYRGITEIEKHIRKYFYWPTIITDFINFCEITERKRTILYLITHMLKSKPGLQKKEINSFPDSLLNPSEKTN